MEWSEFVTFIIEQCSVSQDFTVREKLEHIGYVSVQPSSQAKHIRASRFLPIFHKILEGVGEEVQFHDVDEFTPTWTKCVFKLPLMDRERASKGSDNDLPVLVLDLLWWESNEALIVLRSDFCFECCQFISKTKLTMDTVTNRFVTILPLSFIKIAIRNEWNTQSSKCVSRLFAIGPMNNVYSWEFNEGVKGKLDLCNQVLLTKHTDFVRDILIVKNDLHSYIISCSMDKKVHLYDLESLKYKSTRTGHTAGVQCLAFDGRSILIGGGFDYRIIGSTFTLSVYLALFLLFLPCALTIYCFISDCFLY